MYGSCYNCAYKDERISDPNNAMCITCNFGSHHISDGVVRLSNSRITGFFIIDYRIKNVIFNPPATIVFWADGTKTVVKAHGEEFDPEKGLAMAISKKVLGTGYYPEIKKWTKEYKEKAAEQALSNFEKQMRRVPEVIACVDDLFDLSKKYEGE